MRPRTAGAPPSGEGAHFPQLDGLRALAVLGVMLAHYLPQIDRYVETGSLGVRLFFVLSGFLITGILLHTRDAVEQGLGATRAYVLRFYLRRALRLYPALVLAVVVALAFGLPEMQRSYLWHLGYLSNVYFVRLGQWDGAVSHLWTLAVEEQFYLLWPLLVFAVPRRRLAATVLLVACVGPVYRVVATLSGASEFAVGVLPFACLDTLGIGAFLACCARVDAGTSWTVERVSAVGRVAALPLLLALLALKWAATAVVIVAADALAALAFVGVVAGAVVGFDGWVGRALGSRPLTYLGRISYGVYLYHDFAPRVLGWILARLGRPSPLRLWPPSPWVQRVHADTLTGVFLCFLITLIAAALSWHLFEYPINRLRARLVLPRVGAKPLQHGAP